MLVLSVHFNNKANDLPTELDDFKLEMSKKKCLEVGSLYNNYLIMRNIREFFCSELVSACVFGRGRAAVAELCHWNILRIPCLGGTLSPFRCHFVMFSSFMEFCGLNQL